MKLDITRAWKDEAYRQSLSSEELAQLPENPAGELELSDAELDTVQGGFMGQGLFSAALIGCVQQNSRNRGHCGSYMGNCQSVDGSCASFNRSTCVSFNAGDCNSNAGGNCTSYNGSCFSVGNRSCNLYTN